MIRLRPSQVKRADQITLRDWIEGIVLVLIMSGVMASLDYLAIHGS